MAVNANGSKELGMNGLGGLNKSPEGVVIGLVQLQLPVVVTRADLARQTERIVYMVGKARRNLGTMDLVVFPEYALHGLSMDTNPAIMCSLDGPEVAAFKQACVDNKIWGCFSIMEQNDGAYPFNSGLIIDDTGAIKLYYRKMHPWVPVEPWEPGDIGIPVIEGPKSCKLALIICHDGMFPEMARECAYKGADIMLRTAGYTAPVRHAWSITNQANAFCNLMYTANVCMCGTDGTFNSMGEGMIVGFDGTPTKRNSMSLANLLWVRNFFWDGRAGSLEAQLTEIGHSFLAMVLSPPILEFHRLMVSIGRKFPETGRLFFETGPVSAYSTVATWIAKQQKDGRIGEEDPYRLAVLFLDMLIGEHQLSWLTGAPRAARRDKIDETVRIAVKVFLRGCAAPVEPRQSK